MLATRDNTVPGKILSFLIGIYGVHIYLLYILYDSKFFWISVFTVTAVILFVLFLFNSTIQQIIGGLRYRWYNSAIVLFLFYYILVLGVCLFATGESFMTPLWTVVLPGFFLGIIANTSYEKFYFFRGTIAKISHNSYAKKIYRTYAVVWIVIIAYEGFQIYQNRLSVTLSLITISNDYYQDLGDYCTIFYIGWLALKDHFYNSNQKLQTGFGKFLTLSLIELILIVLFLQILGSNKAPLVIVGIGLYYIFLNRPRAVVPILKTVAGITVTIVIVAVATQIAFDDFQLSGLRFFSELDNGVTQNSSVTSRFDQVGEDGTDQLARNVVFGNVSITNYIHSSVITIQTHLGLVGGLLFWSFIFFHSYYIYFKSDDKISKAILLPILLVSAISSAFWWLPLWFALGFVYMRK